MSDHAARIRAARAYADLTQEQLADELGVDVQTIKRREAGRQEPKRGELLAIAAICRVPMAFMEHGFGEIAENEVLRRLDRIEAALAGENVASVRDYVRGQVTALRGDADDGESGETTPQPAPGPHQQEQPRPPARSPRRS